MATYVSLISWTDQGVRNVKDSPGRAELAAQLAAKMGGSMREILWTIGPYDLVVTMEAPDDESVTAALLTIAGAGNIRTTTMRAFTRDEFQGVLDRM